MRWLRVAGLVAVCMLALASCALFKPSYEESVQHAENVVAQAKQEMIDAGLKIAPEEWDWVLFEEFGGPYPRDTLIDTGDRKAELQVHGILEDEADYPALAQQLTRLVPSPRTRDDLGDIQFLGEDEFGFYSVSLDDYGDFPPTIGFTVTTHCN